MYQPPINDGIFTIQLVISSIIQLVISSINSRIAAWLCQVTADKPFRFAAAAFIAWRSRRWGKAMATYYPWGCEMVNGILYYWSFTYLEPKWPLFCSERSFHMCILHDEMNDTSAYVNPNEASHEQIQLKVNPEEPSMYVFSMGTP